MYNKPNKSKNHISNPSITYLLEKCNSNTLRFRYFGFQYIYEQIQNRNRIHSSPHAMWSVIFAVSFIVAWLTVQQIWSDRNLHRFILRGMVDPTSLIWRGCNLYRFIVRAWLTLPA